MEKDIEILKNLLAEYDAQREESKTTNIVLVIDNKDINAIENLINRVKELEKELQELEFKYQARKDRTDQVIKELKKPKYIIDAKTNKITTLTNDFVSKSKIKEKIEELEKEQEQNRKELARGIDYLSNKIIDAASNKIVINMSIREYLQDLLS